ncbi:MAG: 3'(2'),5'-bisphosphate nucleotidase CysQ [Candidatus Paceibacterota bacterium]|jgi:3'(2'), 5'-bisphosphate nucleotidase
MNKSACDLKVNGKEPILSELAIRVFEIANLAGGILLKYRYQILKVDHKKDEFDPVTIADIESDVLIRNELQKTFPNDLILSEENDDIPDNYSGRVWMVDPLNGTKSFIKGTDTFAVVIGLVENGAPIFGCVTVPAQNKIFYAEKGKGAFQKIDGKFVKICTSSVREIEKARLITREPSGDIRPVEESLDKLPFMERIAGGSGAKLCVVAAGDAEAHINTNMRASKWDIAAPQVILEEAGGIVTDLDGKAIDYKDGSINLGRSFVASANKELHGKIIQELKLLRI